MTLLLLLLASLANAGSIEIRTDPRFELLGVVHLYISSSAIPADYVSRESSYMKEARGRFASLASHAAVVKTAALHPARFDYSARARVFAQLSAPPELAVLSSIPRVYVEAAGGAAAFEAWLDAMRAFARESRFAAWRSKASPGREEGLERFTLELRGQHLLEAIETYAGMKLDGGYLMAPTPFLTPGPVNVVTTLTAGGVSIVTVLGASRAQGGPDRFDPELAADAWHESAHGILDELSNKHSERIARSAGLRRRLPDCYGSWNQCVREHIVRAVMLRLMRRERSPEAATRQREAEASSNEYPYLEALDAKLESYETSRERWPDLTAFYPELLGVFPEAGSGGLRSVASPEIRFETDPGIELLSIVLQLADKNFAEQYKAPRGGADALKSSYAAQAESRFASFSTHPAVGLTGSWLSRDLPVGWLTDLMLQKGAAAPGLAVPLHRLHRLFPGHEKELAELSAAYDDFSRTSSFQRFYDEHRSWYARTSRSVARRAGKSFPTKWASRYTRLGYRPRYRFILAPLLPKAYAIKRTLGEDEDAVEVVVRSFYLDSGPQDDYGFDEFGMGLTHQLLHPILDPLLNEWRSGLDSWPAPVPSGCTGLWTGCAEEHIILAVSIRAAALASGEKAAAALESRFAGSGFPYLGAMTLELREEYEKKRPAPADLAVFYPQLFGAFRKATGFAGADRPGHPERVRRPDGPPVDVFPPGELSPAAVSGYLDEAPGAPSDLGPGETSGSRAHAVSRRAAARIMPEGADSTWTSMRRENLAVAITLRALAVSQGEAAFEAARARTAGQFPYLAPLLAALGEHELRPKPRALSDAAPRLLAAFSAESGQDATALRARAVADFMAGHREQALESLEKAVALDADDAESWISLGVVLESFSRTEPALAAYARAATAARGRPAPRPELIAEALSARAALLASTGRPLEARRALSSALESSPKDWPRRVECEARLKALGGPIDAPAKED